MKTDACLMRGLSGLFVILASFAALTAHATSPQPKFTGRFDKHIVQVSWSAASSCMLGSVASTNELPLPLVDLPLNSPSPMFPRCTDGPGMAFVGHLKLNFPTSTGPGEVGILDFYHMDAPLAGSIELTGDLVIPQVPAVNAQYIKSDAGPEDVPSSPTCPMNSVTNSGPPLVAGTYPISVASSCQRDTFTWPVRDGNDLVYGISSTAELLIYDPRLPTTSTRVIFLLSVNVVTVYRVNTAGGIDLSPARLSFELIHSNPPPATLSLANSGTTNLNFQVAALTDDGHAWLSVIPATGSLAEGKDTDLTVTVNPDVLPKGTNTGRITVTGNAPNSPQSIDVTATRIDVELLALELIQVVQNWSNAVPLVANKPTLARAHLQLTRTNLAPLVFPGARLRGFRDNAELQGSPLGPVNAGLLTVRTNAAERRTPLANSLNFELLPNWLTGRVQMRFESSAAEPVQFSEPAEPGGQANDGVVELVFQSSSTAAVKFVQVRWTNAAGTVHQPTDGDMTELVRRAKAALPVPEVDRTRGQLTWDQGVPNETRLNGRLALMRQADHERPGRGRLYYGVFVGDDDQGGLAQHIPGDVANGWLGAANSFSRNRHVHELGHLLGRPHAVSSAQPLQDGYKQGYCGEYARPTAPDFPFFATFTDSGRTATLGPMYDTDQDFVFGYDSNAKAVVDPFATAELMSYCELTTGWRWPSIYTYTNLWAAITNRFPPPPAAALLAVNPTQDYLLVRGEINLMTDTAQFLPFSWTRTDVPPELPPPGDWTLQLLDSSGAVLSQVAFDLEVPEPDFPTTPPSVGSFLIPVPADPAIKQAAVRRGEALLVTAKASSNPPVVTVLSPNGGEMLGPGAVNLNWRATDADKDSMTYLVQFSPDNGVSWETLTVDWPEQTYSIDSNFLKGTAAGRFRVVASDGFNTGFDDSDGPFTVLNHPPTALILQPPNGSVVSGDQQVVFESYTEDLEDGALPSANVQWISDRDGNLGSGRMIQRSASSLAEGAHQIQLVARDSAGLMSTGVVQITALHQVPANLADLAVSLTPAEAQEGGHAAFALEVVNNGPADAGGVLVTAAIPANATLVSVTPTQGNLATNNSILQWWLPALSASGSAQLTLVLASLDQSLVTVTGQVTAAVTDPDPSNNSATADFIPPPSSVKLGIARADADVVLTWPATAVGFVLESTASLAPGSVWQTESNVVQSGSENSFRITPGGVARFYRLHKP